MRLSRYIKAYSDEALVAYFTRLGAILGSRAPRFLHQVASPVLWLRVVLWYTGLNTCTQLATTMSFGFEAVVVLWVLFMASMGSTVAALFARPAYCHNTVRPEQYREMRTLADQLPEQSQSPFCDTCEIRKPMRSLHCHYPACNRCVVRFDQHSPLTNSCIGAGNQLPYAIFLLLWFLESAICCLFAAFSPDTRTLHPGLVAFLATNVLTTAYLAEAVLDLFTSAATNLTLYEHNHMRTLLYLRSGETGFPSKPTVWANVAEFLELGGVNWQQQYMYTIFDAPDHPLRQKFLKKLRKLRKRAIEQPETITASEKLQLLLSNHVQEDQV